MLAVELQFAITYLFEVLSYSIPLNITGALRTSKDGDNSVENIDSTGWQIDSSKGRIGLEEWNGSIFSNGYRLSIPSLEKRLSIELSAGVSSVHVN